jgi:hypothetical protein
MKMADDNMTPADWEQWMLQTAQAPLPSPDELVTPANVHAIRPGVEVRDGRDPLPMVWFDDIEPHLNGNWIIKGLIPAEADSSIIGEPGSGKSFLALDLSLHIAAGKEWFGRKVRQGLVIYIAAEGQRGQLNRVEAWRRQHGLTGLAFALIPTAVDLFDPKADLPRIVAAIAAAVEHFGQEPILVVIDTVARTSGAADENSNSDMGVYIANGARIRQQFACSLLYVHHVAKNGGGKVERGASALRGALDTSIRVDSSEGNPVKSAFVGKQKDGKDGFAIPFRLEVVPIGEDEDGEAVTSCVVLPTEAIVLPEKQRGPKLSDGQAIALQQLRIAIKAAAMFVPKDIPASLINRQRVERVTTVEMWEERTIAAIASPDKSADTLLRTFRRYRGKLQSAGFVGVYKQWVWEK